MNPLISFLVPAYNAESTIAFCVNSVFSQIAGDYEMIVIDDGSTDHTADILESLCKGNSHLHCESIKNSGACVARNRALALASGQYICFLDADDFISPYFIEVIAPACRKNVWDIVSFGYAQGSSRAHQWEHQAAVAEREVSSDYMLLRTVSTLKTDEGTKMRPATVWGKAYRADFLQEKDAHFVERLPQNQDVMFNMDLLSGGETPKCCFVDACLYYYWLNEDGICRKYMPDVDLAIKEMVDTFSGRVASLDPDIYGLRISCRILSYLSKAASQCYCHPNNDSSFLSRRRGFLQLCNYAPIKQRVETLRFGPLNLSDKLVLLADRYKLFLPLDVVFHLRVWAKRK